MVPSQTSFFTFTVAAVPSSLAYPNYFLATGHLRVQRVTQDAEGINVLDLLTEGSDYTVLGAGEQSGGSVELLAGGVNDLEVGDLITVSRNVPITQVVDYVNNGATFGASTAETSLDKLTMICQMLLDLITNASYGTPNGYVERRIRYCKIDGTQVTSTFLVKDDEI